MRSAPRWVVVALAVAWGAGPHAWAATSLGRITARAGILVDRDTGAVIWERNPDLPLPPASTTKVLTALVALRTAPLDRAVRVSARAAQAQPSKVYLRPGWRLRVRDLLYAVLLSSANDAAEALAEALAGSPERFARRMNETAMELGARNSFFVNPHGLPADGHVATARDLALIFDAALRHPVFRDVVSTKSAVIQPVWGTRRQIALRNHNRLLGHYRVPVVGKTGWTMAAKKCFVGAALPPSGGDLLIALLGSTDLWGDLRKLLDYGLARDRTPESAVQMAQADEISAPDRSAAAAGDSDEEESAAGAPPAGSSFAVQLATFQSSRRAERLRASAAARGYRAAIQKVGGQRPRYRVLLVELESREAARRAARRMRTAHPDLRPIVVLRATR